MFEVWRRVVKEEFRNRESWFSQIPGDIINYCLIPYLYFRVGSLNLSQPRELSATIENNHAFYHDRLQFDSEGRFLFVTPSKRSVSLMSSAGIVIRTITFDAQLRDELIVRADSKGHFIVGCQTWNHVLITSPKGRRIRLIDFREISSILVDAHDSIYLCRYDLNMQVHKFSQDGLYLGLLKLPHSIRNGLMVLDSMGRIVIIDRNKYRVYYFNEDGTIDHIMCCQSQTSNLVDAAIDATGRLVFVTSNFERTRNQIEIFESNGTQLETFEDRHQTPKGSSTNPVGVLIDDVGNLYISHSPGFILTKWE